MANPFQYGSVVTGDAFCNRQTELRDLQRAVEDRFLRLWIRRLQGEGDLVEACSAN